MKKTLTGLAFAAVFMTGCTGTFALTNELYQFHRDQERWIDEALFLVFAITPIYGTAILADAVVLLSLIHISEPTRLLSISYAVFCLKKKKQQTIKRHIIK